MGPYRVYREMLREGGCSTTLILTAFYSFAKLNQALPNSRPTYSHEPSWEPVRSEHGFPVTPRPKASMTRLACSIVYQEAALDLAAGHWGCFEEGNNPVMEDQRALHLVMVPKSCTQHLQRCHHRRERQNATSLQLSLCPGTGKADGVAGITRKMNRHPRSPSSSLRSW